MMPVVGTVEAIRGWSVARAWLMWMTVLTLVNAAAVDAFFAIDISTDAPLMRTATFDRWSTALVGVHVALAVWACAWLATRTGAASPTTRERRIGRLCALPFWLASVIAIAVAVARWALTSRL